MLILALVLQSSVAIPLTGEMLLRSELGDSIHGAAHPAAKMDSASAGQHNPPKELVANAVAQNSDSTLAPSTPKNCVVLKSYMQMTVALSCSDGHDNASCFDASGKQTIQTHSDAILDHLRLAAQSEELPQTRFTLSSSVSDGHVLDVRMEFTGAAAMKFGRDLVQHLRGTAFDWLPPRSAATIRGATASVCGPEGRVAPPSEIGRHSQRLSRARASTHACTRESCIHPSTHARI